MRDFIFEAFLLLLLFFAHFSISNAKQLYDNDDFLVMFWKNPPNFEQFFDPEERTDQWMKEKLTRKYELHLGALYFLRDNWDCAKIGKEFGENGQTECQKYRKYLDILYEYLLKIYAQIDKESPRRIIVRPIFMTSGGKYCLTLAEVVQRLAQNYLANFYILSEYEAQYYPAITKYATYFELIYEDQFNYVDTRTESARPKFDQIIEKMLENFQKKSEGVQKVSFPSLLALSSDSTPVSPSFSAIFCYSPKWDIENTFKEKAFFEFVNGGMNKGRTNAMIKLAYAFDKPDTLPNKRIQIYIDEFKLHFGLLHLIKKNWHCANANNRCAKFRRNLGIFYEYLFKIRYGITAVRPIFQHKARFEQLSTETKNLDGVGVIGILNKISKFYFDQPQGNHQLSSDEDDQLPSTFLNLSNEHELEYVSNLSTNSNPKMAFQESGVQVAIDGTPSAETQIDATSFEGLFRRAFDKEMDAMLEQWKEMVTEQKAKMSEFDYNHLFDSPLISPYFNPQ